MNKVEKIEQEIQALSAEELAHAAGKTKPL